VLRVVTNPHIVYWFRTYGYNVSVPTSRRANRKRKDSYAWSLPRHTDGLGPFSPAAERGLDYARELAFNAEERRTALLDGEDARYLPPLLTVKELSLQGESQTTIRRLIKIARTEAYGDRKQSAIYHYLARRQQLAQQPARICAEPACDNPLPTESRRNRRFCEHHQTSAARIRRHRNQRIAPATENRPYSSESSS
jgi:hypothetical protein